MTVSDLANSGVLVSSDPWVALLSLKDEDSGDRLHRDSYERYLREWQALEKELDRNSLSETPSEYDVEASTAQMLYVMVRWRRPKTVLETGIARGFSSFALLSAVKANGSGVVHSCDVDPACGELVNPSLGANWMKHVIDGRDAEQSFMSIVRNIESVDLFFHDSNHRERWMELEFKTVLPKMPHNAVLGSDDVDLNRAFLSILPFCGKATIVLDSRKASGFALVNRTV